MKRLSSGCMCGILVVNVMDNMDHVAQRKGGTEESSVEGMGKDKQRGKIQLKASVLRRLGSQGRRVWTERRPRRSTQGWAKSEPHQGRVSVPAK